MADKPIPQTDLIRNNLTADYIKSILHYEPETGIFIWKDRPDLPPPIRSRIKNTQAGSLNKSGHRQIRVYGALFLASHLAWIVMTGNFPTRIIDHKNRNPDDNRWNNLRLATRSQNASNRKIHKNNVVGMKGVSRKKNRYEARIQVAKKQIYIGRFDTPEEAHSAYAEASKKMHGEFSGVD